MLSIFRARPSQQQEPGSDRSGQAENDAREKKDDEIHELEDGAELATLNAHIDGPTLLWNPVAKLVTGATGVGSFYIRAGAKIGGWGMAAGREATLKSLEVSRVVVETMLVAAGRDVSSRRTGELGKAEAESLLEKSITMLHTAISTASFVTALGFQSTQAIVNSASTLTIQGLNTLNAVLGETESSRAVAAIVTLIRNELNKPDSHSKEVATYLDLLAGTVAFVFLQRWGRRQTAIEFREAGGEELIWDVVIDDKGFRADVVGTNKKGMLTASKSFTRAHSYRGNDDASAMTLEKGIDIGSRSINLSAQDQTALSDEEIRDRIMSQLPPGTRATITTDTMTLKKVTVQIHEGETAHIEAPPGLMMISESLSHRDSNGNTGDAPQQTVVFRTSLTRTSSSEIEPFDKLRITSTTDTYLDNGDDDVVMLNPALVRRGSNHFDRRTSLDALDITHHDKPLPQTPSGDRGSLANVKRSRKPVITIGSSSESKSGRPFELGSRKGHGQAKAEKEGVIKKALRSLSVNHSSPDVKQHDNLVDQWHMTPIDQRRPLFQRQDSATHNQKRIFPTSANQDSMPYVSPRGVSPNPWESPTSYFAMHEKKRESTISQTDTFSIQSGESRPSSPTQFRTHARSSSSISKTKSHTEMSLHPASLRNNSRDGRNHQRSNSYVPSLYSMATKHSDEAIILAPKTPLHQSMFEDHKMLIALATDGVVPGMFPKQHFVKIIRRFARFATASYGNNFLRVMGLWNSQDAALVKTVELDSDVHHEHNSFSTHTGLPADCIILSSFFDSSGATDSAQVQQSVISPLVHFVSADHDQKAIVLTCRGTLGFEDVLTDMTFDYADLQWRGQSYKVHKGIHAAARRLLSPLGNRVMSSIKQNLEKYPGYGLVICGHSLGGAVAAIIAILISEPSQDQSGEAAFVTATVPKLLTMSSQGSSSPMVSLPPGRPVHAYAYGSPATVSSSLRLATRGLITTIINSNDVVPSLSLGSLHDVRRVALHLKKDTNGQLLQLRSRVLSRVRDAFYSALRTDTRNKGPPAPANIAGDGIGEDTWAWTELLSLRSCMQSEKLLPPGECFIIETSRVFDRLDPQESSSYRGSPSSPDEGMSGAEARYFRALGRPATRVQLKLVRDVEGRFNEVRFGSNMFGDHSPGRYEAALSALEKGVCEE